MRGVREDLTRHLGGFVSAVQARLIDRACWLTLRLAQFDTMRARDEVIDDVLYLAWSNSLSRTLARLGPAAAAKPPSLAEVMVQARREREAREAAA